MARVCVDACFLIGLFDSSDQHHDIAVRHFESIFGEESGHHTLVIPWPILFESLGTRFARDPRKVIAFVDFWKYLERSGRLALLDDTPYRNAPLTEHLEPSTRTLSLVDRIVRAMILSEDQNFDYFLTFNTADFMDACRGSGIHLINDRSTAESYGF